MKKSKVNPRIYAALYLFKKNASEKVSLGNRVFSAMTGNLSYTTPVPSLLDLQTVTTALENAIAAAEGGGDAEKTTLIEAEGNFDNLIVRLKEYAENTANATPASAASILTSGGFDTRKTPEKAPVPSQPVALARYTSVSGTIKLLIKEGKNARRFDILMTTTPGTPASWTKIATVTKRQYLVTDLTPGTAYSFKVVPFGTAGEGPESPVTTELAAN